MRQIVFILCLYALPINGQTINKENAMAGPEFSLLKYSISFADQSQMSYDGSDLSKSGFVKFMPSSIAEAADIDYYVGHYGSSAGAYYSVVSSLPRLDKTSGIFSLYKTTMNLVDYKNLNEDQTKLYTALANVSGMLYQTRGKYVYAEAMMNRGMEVRAKRFGKTSREFINSLCNLAVLQKDLGNYEESEKMFDYLTKTIPKIYSVNSFQYVVVINNKAMLLAELGRTKEAIDLLDEALTLGKEVLSDKYIDYERILTNRALIEQESGSQDKANALYKEIISKMEAKGFEDHPDYNNVMIYYGALLIAQNDKDVFALLQSSLTKVKKRYGESHVLTAKALSNLGEYYLGKNAYAEAKEAFDRVAEIQLKLLGDKHKDYLLTQTKLGICNWQLSHHEQASVHFKNAIDNYLFLLDSFFPTMSEAEKAKFWATLKPSIDTFMAYAISTGATNPGNLIDAYNLQLKTKGLLFNSTHQTKMSILSSKDTVVTQMYEEWLEAKGALANYYSIPLEEIEEDKINIKELESEANLLERKLSQQSALFQSAYTNQNASFQSVISSLQEKEAAVEIIRVTHRYGPHKGEVEYAGLIAAKNKTVPDLIRIQDGKNLEKRSLSLYKNSIQAKIEESNSFSTYWKPFQSSLQGFEKIYVSLDGVYNSINLNTLKQENGNYLIDDEVIVLVPSTRFIAEVQSTKITLSNFAGYVALVGSPDFGKDELITPLPGTKIEIEKIDTLLHAQQVKTDVMMEDDATEVNLKALTSPTVLHIATHGYFLSDISTGSGMTMGVSISRAKENPLLRSGLLFTGAASSLIAEPTLNGGDNGILNAYEVMNLDLKETKLVVMSACETGTGEIVNGEGVYGLSRSFQIAGAKKIIMSLWKVDDDATQELMRTFYSSWLDTGNPSEAFLLAQRAVKEKFSDPYYWGAFVLMN